MLVGWVGSDIPGLRGFLVLWKRRRRMSRLKLSIVGFYGTRWGTLQKFASARRRPGQITFHPFPAIWPLSQTWARHLRGPPGHPRDAGNVDAFFMCERSGERNKNRSGPPSPQLGAAGRRRWGKDDLQLSRRLETITPAPEERGVPACWRCCSRQPDSAEVMQISYPRQRCSQNLHDESQKRLMKLPTSCGKCSKELVQHSEVEVHKEK